MAPFPQRQSSPGAFLPLSSRTLTFVSGIIRRHRVSIGSPWRKLNSGQQALLVLVYLRKGETFAEVAAGFGVGTSTAWRYVNETVALLAARAPKLRKAVRDAKKVVTIPLAPRTARAIDLAIGERTGGPMFLAADGRRLDWHGAGRIVRKTARRAGIGKTVTPHTLRHAFITAALDAGVPLRDVQEAASHADPRTTIRYDRARGSLDRHATYIVAAYIAGAAR